MFEISVGAHSYAMHSRLKAAPAITLSEREMPRCSWVRTYLQEVTVLSGINWRIADKHRVRFCPAHERLVGYMFFLYTKDILFSSVLHFAIEPGLYNSIA